MTWQKDAFSDDAECLRRSDAGWQSVPGTLRSDEERLSVCCQSCERDILKMKKKPIWLQIDTSGPRTGTEQLRG